jgi:hypothetical protein
MNRATRMPVLALAAVALGLLVVGGILLVGRLGAADATPAPASAPAASAAPSSAAPSSAAAPTATAADPRSTPEGAVRAFLAAFATARRSDDPSAAAPFTTGPGSSAYRSVAAFLAGQRSLGKASVLTEQRVERLQAAASGATATVTLDYTVVGYDAGLADASPLQTPQALPTVHMTVRLHLVGGLWLVDAYESHP